jgi:hypothetical protein
MNARDNLVQRTRRNLARRGIKIRVAAKRKNYVLRTRKSAPVDPQGAWTCYCGASGTGGTPAYWAHPCRGPRTASGSKGVAPLHRTPAKLMSEVEAERAQAQDDDRTPTRRV